MSEQISTVPRTLAADTSEVLTVEDSNRSTSTPRSVVRASDEATPRVEITLLDRLKAAEIIERLQKTFGMDIPEMGLKMSIKPNYLYSIKGEYKHKNGTPHCPPEAVRDVLTWGDR